jgi:hypothetical protein
VYNRMGLVLPMSHGTVQARQAPDGHAGQHPGDHTGHQGLPPASMQLEDLILRQQARRSPCCIIHKDAPARGPLRMERVSLLLPDYLQVSREMTAGFERASRHGVQDPPSTAGLAGSLLVWRSSPHDAARSCFTFLDAESSGESQQIPQAVRDIRYKRAAMIVHADHMVPCTST